jgi:hypothetical protein
MILLKGGFPRKVKSFAFWEIPPKGGILPSLSPSPFRGSPRKSKKALKGPPKGSQRSWDLPDFSWEIPLLGDFPGKKETTFLF